jgi:uncharacterized repeat protein (TIGR03806 family)
MVRMKTHPATWLLVLLSAAAAQAEVKFPGSKPSGSLYRFSRAYPQLKLKRPVYLTYSPFDPSTFYVVEQAGRIQAFRRDSAGDGARVFLDIRDKVDSSGNEMGLLGMAFDPVERKYFYLHYNVDDPVRTVISRFELEGASVKPGSEKVLLTQKQPYSNHKGGTIIFGPDNLLYIGLGDGGSGGDPHGNSQKLDTWLGKILRIDPRQTPYRVPEDNPFVGRAGALPEIYAYGIRNPWRFTFDRENGDLWLGDVGQDEWEEINVVRKGGNYGWSYYEGTHRYDGIYVSGPPEGSRLIPPVFEYPHPPGISVTGGYVYRGRRMPELRGAYVYGDFGSGQIWRLGYDRDKGRAYGNEEIGRVELVSSFAEDPDGELLALSLGGQVFRLERAPGGSSAEGIPRRISETGLFDDPARLRPADELVEYQVNSPLWSDAAAKRRWIALPPGGKIAFRAADPWTFPVGTALVKHFELGLASGGTKRLETRVFFRHVEGWAGYTYRWNDEQSDAELLAGAVEERLSVPDTAGAGSRRQTWHYPSRAECLTCHSTSVGGVLGVNTAQLNRDGQLERWSRRGMFEQPLGDVAQYDALADPADRGQDPARRARSYLAANCAFCHNPSGPTPVSIDLRFTTPLAAMQLADVPPASGDFGVADARRVAPGAREKSMLWHRMKILGAGRMPPLGSSVVDPLGTETIGEWIDRWRELGARPGAAARAMASEMGDGGAPPRARWRERGFWPRTAAELFGEAARAATVLGAGDLSALAQLDRAAYGEAAARALAAELGREPGPALTERTRRLGLVVRQAALQGDGPAWERARDAYRAFLSAFQDRTHGGFLEASSGRTAEGLLAVPRDFLLELEALDPDPAMKREYRRVLAAEGGLAAGKLWPPRAAWLAEAFDAEWNPVISVGAVANVGRAFEASWIWLELDRRGIGSPAERARFRRAAAGVLAALLERSPRDGKGPARLGPVDWRQGGFLSAFAPETGEPVWDLHKHAGVQVYGILALTLAERRGVLKARHASLAREARDRALDAFLASGVDRATGAPRAVVARSGEPLRWLASGDGGTGRPAPSSGRLTELLAWMGRYVSGSVQRR